MTAIASVRPYREALERCGYAVPAEIALAEILERKNRCPEVFALAQVWHVQVKLDAEREQPVTHHGRLVRASSRPWPGVGVIGECACGSSLVYAVVDEDDADLTTQRADVAA